MIVVCYLSSDTVTTRRHFGERLVNADNLNKFEQFPTVLVFTVVEWRDAGHSHMTLDLASLQS